jgi:O-methyltransferase
MKAEMTKFVRSAPSEADRQFRQELLRRFASIEKHIHCGHSPYQFVLMAKFLLNLKVGGPIVECGCYKGGSSAKLSLLARRTGRRLIICDSFAGLPTPESEKELHQTGHVDTPDFLMQAGDYRGELEEVRENVRRYGDIEVCEFVPGWFEDSLAGLDVDPAFVFIDVDFWSSARTCLKFLWPRLVPGGLFFTHEATSLDYLEGTFDPQWWQSELGECPPMVRGAASGLSELATSIAYFVKPKA